RGWTRRRSGCGSRSPSPTGSSCVAPGLIPPYFDPGRMQLGKGKLSCAEFLVIITVLHRQSDQKKPFQICSINLALEGKRLALLRELVPHAALIAVLINPKNPHADTFTRDAWATATPPVRWTAFLTWQRRWSAYRWTSSSHPPRQKARRPR